MSIPSAARNRIGILVAMVVTVVALTGAAVPPPFTVVALEGTPRLWFANAAGVLHLGGDTRALAGRHIDWSSRIEVSEAHLCAQPTGAPWLTAGLLKDGDPIYLVKWETDWAQPRLLHIQSIREVEFFGIDESNYGDFVLDIATWEARYGLSVAGLQRGVLDPVCAPPAPAQVAQAAAAPAVQTTETATGNSGKANTGTGSPSQPHPTPGNPGQPTPVPGNPGQPTPVPGNPSQPTPVPGNPSQPNPNPGNPNPTSNNTCADKFDGIVEAVCRVLAGRLSVAGSSLTLVSAQQATWPTGNLGCPGVSAQVLTPGHQVVMSYNGQIYTYRTNADASYITTC